MPKEPLARGVVTALSRSEPIDALQKEALSILRALDAEAASGGAVPPEADFVALLLAPDADVDALALPDLKDRAATAIAVGADVPEARVALTRARKRLRQAGAALGAHELVFRPDDFGYLGLESDGLRERLEILLRSLVHDAERLRLRREGWEEPTP